MHTAAMNCLHAQLDKGCHRCHFSSAIRAFGSVIHLDDVDVDLVKGGVVI